MRPSGWELRIAWTLFAACAVAQAQPAPAADPAAGANAAVNAAVDLAEAGRRIYVSSCLRCHGIRLATQGIGFDLRSFPPGDKARFVRSVTQGLRAMPSWRGVLRPEQMDQVWAYIGSVNGWPAADEPPAAELQPPP